MAYEVLVVYLALALWAVVLGVGVRRSSYRPFLAFGIVILLFLNVRYFVAGIPSSISFFVGIYDVFDNLGLDRSQGAPALATCADNACSVWDRYVQHPSWGVAFYDRFANGPQLRRNLLYAHIFFNSTAFVLLHVQLWRPGTGDNRDRHRLIGRISFAAVTLGTLFAVWLSTQHGSVEEYGGNMSMVGFWSMSALVYGTAIMGVLSARRGEVAAHRTWMIRYAGAMWGSFWLFRVMLVVTGPLLRNYESASLLLSIWLSAPLGILIAETFRRRPARSAAGAPPNRVMASSPGG